MPVRTPARMRSGKAYCRKKGDVYCVEWVDGSGIRSETYPTKEEAQLRRVQRQNELLGISRDRSEPQPFVESIRGRSGASGAAWRDLLTAGAALVAQNPGCERQQRALKSVAAAASAARKFMTADQLVGDDTEEMSDGQFLSSIGKMLEPVMQRAGISEEGRKAVLRMLEMGKEDAS